VANSGFFGSQYFVPDNFNADPYIYIRSIGNNGTTFNKWAKIKVTFCFKVKKILLYLQNKPQKMLLGGLLGINDTWLRFRDQKEMESQDELDSMQYSGIYLLSQNSKLEYVRNCVLVVIGKPNVCCVQNLYNYSGDIYKYRVKWFSRTWGKWKTFSLT
jgi:hypothetical protein